MRNFGSFSEREAALFVAEDQGFFRKHAVDARLVHLRSGPVSLAALAAGESQFYNGSVTGAILRAILHGRKLRLQRETSDVRRTG